MRKTKTKASPRQPRTGKVALPAELSIAAAAALHARLMPLVASPAQVVLDASAVLRVHTAPMQVLVAFCRTRAGAGQRTAVRNAPEALRIAADRLGLASELGLEPAH